MEEVRRAEAAKAERQRLEADLEGHRQALRNAEEEIATLRRIQKEHDKEIVDLRQEIAGLRRSWSWRLTAPLRTVLQWLGRGRS